MKITIDASKIDLETLKDWRYMYQNLRHSIIQNEPGFKNSLNTFSTMLDEIEEGIEVIKQEEGK